MTECVECGDEIQGGVFIPIDGPGPMDIDCFKEYTANHD